MNPSDELHGPRERVGAEANITIEMRQRVAKGRDGAVTVTIL
jgi:hypothetical protein